MIEKTPTDPATPGSSATQQEQVTVVLVDDQAVIRRGLRAFLSGCPDITVIGEAASGQEAVQLALELKPDVILMDIRMPGGDGLWATEQVMRLPRSPSVLILTTFDLDEYLFGALDAGAAGFALKDSDLDELAEAIRTTAQGGSWLTPSLTSRLIHEFSNRGASDAPVKAAPLSDLTDRENEVAARVADGWSNQEIAAALYLEVTTIKAHVASIFSKLGVANRVQLAVRYLQSTRVEGQSGIARELGR